jgi:hypothetical protein
VLRTRAGMHKAVVSSLIGLLLTRMYWIEAQ